MPREKLAGETMMASLHQLSRDGRAWIAAEAAFAQAEVASDGKRLAVMLALVAVGFGCLFTAVILLSVFVVVFLAPHVSGLGNAAGLLGLALVAIAALTGWRIWSLATKQFGLLSVLKRWWNIAAKAPGPEP